MIKHGQIRIPNRLEAAGSQKKSPEHSTTSMLEAAVGLKTQWSPQKLVNLTKKSVRMLPRMNQSLEVVNLTESMQKPEYYHGEGKSGLELDSTKNNLII